MKKRFSKANIIFMSCLCNTLEKMDGNVSEQELKNALYKLGTYAYREYHDAGVPASLEHPSLGAEKKVWSKADMKFVPESQLLQPA